MNFFTKHRVLLWILTGLLVVALSVLGSVIYFTWMEQEKIETMQVCSSSCQMLEMELGLDASQNAQLEQILERFREPSEALVSSLRDTRMALMVELRKEQPDTAQIRLLTEEIGANQTSLTALAATQYLQIRSICSPEQQERLCDVYCDLFGCPRAGMGHGKKQDQDQGSGQGQHRHRKGKTWD